MQVWEGLPEFIDTSRDAETDELQLANKTEDLEDGSNVSTH